MKFKVQFFKGTKAQYDSISPDRYTFYFLTDTDQVFLGETQLTNTDFATFQAQIYDLAQRINELENGAAKIVTVTNENKEFIQSKISEKDRFYLYVDTDGYGSPDLKIGDGTSYVSSLPFLSQGNSLRFESLNLLLQGHIQDNDRHIREMEYVSNQDQQAYGDITERDYWNNKVAAYTTKFNGETEQHVSSNQIAAYADSDFILSLDNADVIVKDNIPKRIKLKDNI